MQDYVSVIIPVYNRKEILPRSVESVLKQKHPYFELIIVDDHSEDDIKAVISQYKDSRLIYLSNKQNYGVSYSRNRAIRIAKYDFVAFLDSDDEWLPDKLTEQLLFFRENSDLNLVHTEEIWIRNGRRVNQKKHHKKSGGDIFIPSLELCLISPSSIMLRKKIFTHYGYFDETLPVCEDYDLWLRILAHEPAGFIDKPLVIKYGGHADQLSRKMEAIDQFRVRSLMKFIKDSSLKSDYKNAVRHCLKKKIMILIQGAYKREKVESLAVYHQWMQDLKETENIQN